MTRYELPVFSGPQWRPLSYGEISMHHDIILILSATSMLVRLVVFPDATSLNEGVIFVSNIFSPSFLIIHMYLFCLHYNAYMKIVNCTNICVIH